MDYKTKYLKYKNKYMMLQKQMGGLDSNPNPNPNPNPNTIINLDCIYQTTDNQEAT